MSEINPSYARVACGCGATFQVLRQIVHRDDTVEADWDQEATMVLYYAHIKVCPSQPPA